jgi:hypothetical protein
MEALPAPRIDPWSRGSIDLGPTMRSVQTLGELAQFVDGLRDLDDRFLERLVGRIGGRSDAHQGRSGFRHAAGQVDGATDEHRHGRDIYQTLGDRSPHDALSVGRWPVVDD